VEPARRSRSATEVFWGDRVEELAEFLFRSQVFPFGAILLTGTGIIPPDSFTLNERDVVRIEITGIGVLENPVVVV